MKEIIFIPGYIENWIILLDLESVSKDDEKFFQENFDLYLDKISEVFLLNYPFYLEKMFILKPQEFLRKKIENFIKRLAKLTAQKIILIDNEKYLQNMIDPSQLEKKYGGTCENFEIFWPPKNIINTNVLKFLEKENKKTDQNSFQRRIDSNRLSRDETSYRHHSKKLFKSLQKKTQKKGFLLDEEQEPLNSSSFSEENIPLNMKTRFQEDLQKERSWNKIKNLENSFDSSLNNSSRSYNFKEFFKQKHCGKSFL